MALRSLSNRYGIWSMKDLDGTINKNFLVPSIPQLCPRDFWLLGYVKREDTTVRWTVDIPNHRPKWPLIVTDETINEVWASQ
jgi:hypothetical protein